ncbi:hypothetical protein KQI33_04810 [Enterococcus devriesei]|uniref:hypothetical protein n=1 Tax=Enterococcus devriesei TaxID=319970 RepID=UPI001C12799F|nr:hypothetical protein [Enterococcus devriesei]MBU5364688.1 hypothetical protein [Enterococcus devriesei]
MTSKKWYRLFWNSLFQLFGGLLFLFVFKSRYSHLVALIWFIAALVNVSRGIRLRKLDS